MIIWIAPVLLWLSGKAQDYIDFLRTVPSLIAPKPSPLSSPYTPPFTGGQSVGVSYSVVLHADYFEPNDRTYLIEFLLNGSTVFLDLAAGATDAQIRASGSVAGALSSSDFELRGQEIWVRGVFRRPTNLAVTNLRLVRAIRTDGTTDTGGNPPNPITPPSIPDDGLFSPSNPLIADENGTVNPAAIVLAPAFPLAIVAAVLAGYAAAMQAAQAATTALEAVKRIAEGLESLKDLWEKLKEFLNEWEKNRPKKRDTVRQTYGQLVGDGALDFLPSNNQRYQSIQLDVVITTIPIGFGKYFGSFSPHRYRYKELGYIAFYSTTQGILEVHSIQFKRTSLQIPKLAIGFIYHLGLNNQIRGYAFGTFSIEKS